MHVLGGVWLGLGGAAALADEPPANKVRTSATVEVIEDARRVDDIISRMKSQPRSAQAPEAQKAAAPEGEAARPERPALPSAEPDRAHGEHQRDKEQRRDRREQRGERRDAHHERHHR
jgi:hypothetical protein